VSTVPLAVALLLASAAEGWAQRTFVLVRHAEKLDHSDDPPLSPVGRARASALADLLRGAGVTAIVATEYQRTQATAAPLAKRLGIAPEIVPARQLDALVARLHASAAGSVVLVVGHSNTVPIVLTRLGWKGTLDLHDRDYDDVFVVVPREGAEPSVLRLKYGRKTSP
jgi:broad specificity phosphatase PhoE